MAIISKMTIRYLRRAGFPSYSHVELEVEEEILLEEGDNARDLRRELFKNMAEDAAERIEPIAAGYRKVESNKGAGADDPRTKALLRRAAAEANASRKPATVQGELDPVKPPALPEEREPGREMPKYNEEGQRIRGSGQKRFVLNEINLAWVALADAQIVETTPDVSEEVNTERQDIRKWLTMTPLDPKFSSAELVMVVESYSRWRGQGLTTQEAMQEVGNDYTEIYGAGEAAAKDEDESEPVDQDAAADQQLNGQHGSDNGGSEEQPEPGGGEAGEPGSEDLEGNAGDGEAEA